MYLSITLNNYIDSFNFVSYKTSVSLNIAILPSPSAAINVFAFKNLT